MAKRLWVQLSILGMGAFLGVRIAIPCSLIPPSETGASYGVVGAQPLLVAERNDPDLRDGRGRAIALDPATPDPRLASAKGGQARSLFFFVPRDPLASDSYSFDSGRVTFTVTASAADAAPPLGSSGSIDVFVDHDDGEGGCFGMGVSSCGDTSNVNLQVGAISDQGMYLVEFTSPDRPPFSRLVTDRFQMSSFLFYGAFDELGSLDVELCAKVTGVSPSGALGATLDLGCDRGE